MQCPSCGRPISFEEKYAKVVACKYCNSILEFGGSELTKVGEQGDFIDFPSIFVVGKDCEYQGKKIHIKGSLRYEYDGGFFDKYYATVDGKQMYIKEDDGTIKFVQDGELTKSDITLVDKIAGNNINIGGKDLFIQEVGILKLVNLRGFVTSKLIPGREYEYLDGVYNGKMYFLERDGEKGVVRISHEV